MVSTKTRGKVLEELVQYFLKKQGYKVISPEDDHPGITEKNGELRLQGRGSSHQIDALGQADFTIPFVYPIRILSEAKCWNSKTPGLKVVRNYIAVLKDISENYFIQDNGNLTQKMQHRHTDCAAIFSTNGFTKDAQQCAYAHGIYLVPVSPLEEIVDDICRIIEANGLSVETVTQEYLNYESKKQVYFGLVSDRYPIAIVSDNRFPAERFAETDTQEVEIGYEVEDSTNQIQNFTVRLDDWEGEFQLPRYAWQNYVEQPDFAASIMDFKEQHIHQIDIPLQIDGIRRILALTLDEKWLETQRRFIDK